MNTGDSFTDGQKRSWRLGPALGHGLWSRSWSVTTEGGREATLCVPLGSDDLPEDAPRPKGMLEACAKGMDETAALLEAAELPFLPRLDHRFALPDGRPALLLPAYPSSLKRRMEEGLSLSKALELTDALSGRLAQLGATGRVHGDLRPSNILLNERGEPVLLDLLPDAVAPFRQRLVELAPTRRPYTPPEARNTRSAGWDTWALCQILLEVAMFETGAEPPAPPSEGLSKVDLATLRDHALARLKRENANPRFLNQVAERLGSLLNRGLSKQSDPSPPYRFQTGAELRPRVAEISSLAHPRVENVGRLLLAASARDNVFQGDADVAFSVTVGASAGVTDHEHIVCGVQITDLDDEEKSRVRVPDTRYDVQVHPSGRMRFQFQLPGIPPGRYRARIAFSVRDSGHEPMVADGEFEVRPPPGYVPPPEVTAPPAQAQAISLAERRKERAVTQDAAIADDADFLPTPIAPSAVGPAFGSQVDDPSYDPPDPGSIPPSIRVQAGNPTEVSRPGGYEGSDDDLPMFATDGDTDPSVAPLPPPVSATPMGAAPRPSFHPTPTAPGRVSATPRPPQAGPGLWEDDLPSPDPTGDISESWVPGPSTGEDLPDWDQPASSQRFDLSQLPERILETLRNDPVLVVMAAVIGGLLLIFSFLLLLKALALLF